MLNCNLLNKNESELIQTTFSKCLSGVYAHILEYKDGITICIFIRIVFEGNTSLIITTGSFADNIVLLDESDFKTEKEKYDLQDDVEMRLHMMNDFEEIVGKKLINVECVQKPNEEYYWQMNFIFQKRALNIRALIDELQASTSLLPWV
jgi:hypothetical protein